MWTKPCWNSITASIEPAAHAGRQGDFFFVEIRQSGETRRFDLVGDHIHACEVVCFGKIYFGLAFVRHAHASDNNIKLIGKQRGDNACPFGGVKHRLYAKIFGEAGCHIDFKADEFAVLVLHGPRYKG